MDNDRNKLLKRLQICDFTLDEMVLYLDTHPDDTCALDYFKKYQELQKQAALEYIEKYGPINAENYIYKDKFTWIDNPWPWEREEDLK